MSDDGHDQQQLLRSSNAVEMKDISDTAQHSDAANGDASRGVSETSTKERQQKLQGDATMK